MSQNHIVSLDDQDNVYFGFVFYDYTRKVFRWGCLIESQYWLLSKMDQYIDNVRLIRTSEDAAEALVAAYAFGNLLNEARQKARGDVCVGEKHGRDEDSNEGGGGGGYTDNGGMDLDHSNETGGII